ncbi:MAG: DUF1311 domain-containing protein [Desulfovibrio sp.]|nr:DUF1311 domain-containing protein [Desulfovibrio sp.]
MLKFSILIFFTIFYPHFSFASDIHNDPNDKTLLLQCFEKDQQSDLNLRDCTLEENARLDKILNNTYKKIMSSNMSSKEKETIKSAQRAWILYIDQSMKAFENFAYNGTLWEVTLNHFYQILLENQCKVLNQIQL